MAGRQRSTVRLIVSLTLALVLVMAAISALEHVGPAGDVDAVEPADAAGEIDPSSWHLTPSADSPAGETGVDEERDPVGGFDGDGAAGSSSADQAGLSTIPIPTDFIGIFERDEDLAEFHAELENEPEDLAWAGRVERYLQDHYDASLDPNAYRVLSVECRSSACEILALGYGDDALRGWMTSFAALVESDEQIEALIGSHGTASCGGSDLAPGVLALNCRLRRVEDEPPAAAQQALSLDTPYPDGAVVEPVVVDDFVVEAIESSRELYDLHRRLEQESVDYSWANYVEPLIEEHLQGLDPTRGLSLLGVTCRTTLCEVQMSAQSEEQAMIELVTELMDFARLEWHDLNTAALNTTDTPNGEQTGIVWLLERRAAGD